jgi:curved DNA-binding protein
MEFKDYYATLGIERGADEKEIKRAYRRLAREHHPDVNPDDNQAAERFRAVSEAYEVLGDPEKRALYDRYGRDWQQAQQAADAGIDFGAWQAAQQRAASAGAARGRPETGYTYATAEDLEEMFGEAGYSDFFESLFGRRAPQAGNRPRRGRDIDAPVTLQLLEAYHGTTRSIERDGRRYELRIPPGVGEGSRVRMRGKGEPGLAGGEPGDLYLVVHLAPDARFSRRDDDLETVVDVPVLDALLGGEVDVPTPTGPVTLRIPAGTAQGARIRLRGRGMPRLGKKGEFGDLFARVNLQLPRGLAPEERALLEQWRALRAARERTGGDRQANETDTGAARRDPEG